MALRLPIGNYVPGTTPVHKADTRVKLLLLVVYAVALFVVHSWIGLAILGVALVVMIILAKLGLRSVARGITPVLFILVFTFLANTITFYPIFAVSLSGALRGLYFVLRILFLVVATSLLTLTTPIVALTDAFTTLMRPLSKLKVPVEDIAMIISIAMRFIPITFDEAQKLIYAQRARGASFAKGGPIKRVKAYLPV
ncbi:MAG: energy-coupling factor transporter transmembrane protein EcfT, partial [Coriobacteriales bacterium]|nr:energy-coupling factor transporter transmembrane protein EcfT [Coriobacteriales bacterium]